MSDQNERLSRLVQENDTLLFFHSEDPGIPEIKWMTFGVPEPNEVIVRAEVAERRFTRLPRAGSSIQRWLTCSLVSDAMDHRLAEELSMAIWKEHGGN